MLSGLHTEQNWHYNLRLAGGGFWVHLRRFLQKTWITGTPLWPSVVSAKALVGRDQEEPHGDSHPHRRMMAPNTERRDGSRILWHSGVYRGLLLFRMQFAVPGGSAGSSTWKGQAFSRYLVFWMRMASKCSHLWICGPQLEVFWRIRRCGLVRKGVSQELALGFKTPRHPCELSASCMWIRKSALCCCSRYQAFTPPSWTLTL